VNVAALGADVQPLALERHVTVTDPVDARTSIDEHINRQSIDIVAIDIGESFDGTN